MSEMFFWRRASLVVVLLGALQVGHAAASSDTRALPRSALDAQLFYQLLIGEMELRNGQPGTAYQVFLEAARRTKDPQLFRRAMDIALQARAGEEALVATKAWHLAQPTSADPLRLQLQILAALNRLNEAADPIRALIRLTPANGRASLISALPRIFDRATDKGQGAAVLEDVLAPYRDDAATRTPVQVTLGRAWLAAGDTAKALRMAQRAHADDPSASGPVLLSIELSRGSPQAERIVTEYLERADAAPALRLAYVRHLTSTQRFAEAITQLVVATAQQPEVAAPFLTLGALQLESRQFEKADAALLQYLRLAQAAQPVGAEPAASAASSPTTVPGDDDADTDIRVDQGVVQAWLMLAQSAEQRGQFKAAEDWLSRIQDPARALDVQARRASLMARQGNIDGAVASLQSVPESTPGDARAKLVAQAQLLRDVKRWQAAFDTFKAANDRFPDDIDLLYEQAMMAEKINRMDEMERLLRRVIELKPDHGHAHNALGYSLADRGLRLPEARTLIRRALDLRAGDPFITDSLGWVEFRMGNLPEAIRLLRQAWASRPDTEIGAHLGEVLWVSGQQDEARAIWRQALGRDRDNEVLRETLSRLGATP